MQIGQSSRMIMKQSLKPRVEFWFEKYGQQVNLYQRSREGDSQGALKFVHRGEYDRTRGLEGCVGVAISGFIEEKCKAQDHGPSDALKALATDSIPGFTVLSGEHVIQIDYVANNIRSGREIEGTTYSKIPHHWLS